MSGIQVTTSPTLNWRIAVPPELTLQRQWGLRQKQGKMLIVSRPPSGGHRCLRSAHEAVRWHGGSHHNTPRVDFATRRTAGLLCGSPRERPPPCLRGLAAPRDRKVTRQRRRKSVLLGYSTGISGAALASEPLLGFLSLKEDLVAEGGPRAPTNRPGAP